MKYQPKPFDAIQFDANNSEYRKNQYGRIITVLFGKEYQLEFDEPRKRYIISQNKSRNKIEFQQGDYILLKPDSEWLTTMIKADFEHLYERVNARQ